MTKLAKKEKKGKKIDLSQITNTVKKYLIAEMFMKISKKYRHPASVRLNSSKSPII